jgi:hypothetical protein
MRLLGPARVLFAAASVSLAVLSLAYGDSGLMGQSVPASMPWRETWVYGSALVLLIAGAALCFPRTASPGALTIGACLAVWALTCTAQIASNPLSFAGWYGFCEAMTVLVGAWILYALLQGRIGCRATWVWPTSPGWLILQLDWAWSSESVLAQRLPSKRS